MPLDALDGDLPDGGCSGDIARCLDGKTIQRCKSGTWTSEVCAVGCSAGTCVTITQLTANPFCALGSDGSVRCWGYNLDGAAGPGPVELIQPQAVVGVTNAVQIASGYNSAGARLADGRLVWWGRVPTKRSPTKEPPTLVSGVTGAVDFAIGIFHACGRWADGSVRCWGQGDQGQLGNGLATDSFAPSLADVPTAKGALRIFAGPMNSFALLAGEARAWGQGGFGEIGTGKEEVPLTPQLAFVGATQLAPGIGVTCARLGDGTAACAGRNDYGELGDGTKTPSPKPVPVKGLSKVREVAVGSQHGCAVLEAGGVRCWGRNDSGQLGDGGTTSSTAVIAVPDSILPPSGVKALALSAGDGDSTTCALGNDGVTVVCWGSNLGGNLGGGLDSTVYPKKLTPVAVKW